MKPGQQIVDLTSGNTGIGLAALAAARGYPSKFYLRNTISDDKLKLLAQYGAEIVLIDNSAFLEPGAIHAIIDRVRRENPDAYYTNQRANPANPRVHFETTGPEIWRETKGKVDIFVAAVGTGGTISGTGRFLKQQNPDVQVVVVEPGPASVPSLDIPYPDAIEGVHKVTNVEPGYLPENFDASVVDEVIVTETAQAREFARVLAQREGILAGTSSGAVLFADCNSGATARECRQDDRRHRRRQRRTLSQLRRSWALPFRTSLRERRLRRPPRSDGLVDCVKMSIASSSRYAQTNHRVPSRKTHIPFHCEQ